LKASHPGLRVVIEHHVEPHQHWDLTGIAPGPLLVIGVDRAAEMGRVR